MASTATCHFRWVIPDLKISLPNTLDLLSTTPLTLELQRIVWLPLTARRSSCTRWRSTLRLAELPASPSTWRKPNLAPRSFSLGSRSTRKVRLLTLDPALYKAISDFPVWKTLTAFILRSHPTASPLHLHHRRADEAVSPAAEEEQWLDMVPGDERGCLQCQAVSVDPCSSCLLWPLSWDKFVHQPNKTQKPRVCTKAEVDWQVLEDHSSQRQRKVHIGGVGVASNHLGLQKDRCLLGRHWLHHPDGPQATDTDLLWLFPCWDREQAPSTTSYEDWPPALCL